MLVSDRNGHISKRTPSLYTVHAAQIYPHNIPLLGCLQQFCAFLNYKVMKIVDIVVIKSNMKNTFRRQVGTSRMDLPRQESQLAPVLHLNGSRTDNPCVAFFAMLQAKSDRCVDFPLPPN